MTGGTTGSVRGAVPGGPAGGTTDGAVAAGTRVCPRPSWPGQTSGTSWSSRANTAPVSASRSQSLPKVRS